MDIKDFLYKTFYILDCEDFIYYPKRVYIVGFSVGSDCEMKWLDKEENEYETERLKTLEEVKSLAEKLNSDKENKKRAEDWNKPENKYARLLFLESCGKD